MVEVFKTNVQKKAQSNIAYRNSRLFFKKTGACGV